MARKDYGFESLLSGTQISLFIESCVQFFVNLNINFRSRLVFCPHVISPLKVRRKTRLFGKRSLKEIGYVGVGSQVCPQRKKLNVSDKRRLALSFFALIPKNLACKDFACLATVSLHMHGGR